MLLPDLSAQLMKHLDMIVAIYAVLFGIGAYAWYRDPQWKWEAGLYVLSMVIMPCVYVVMFQAAVVLTPVFAPQFPLLVLMACCSVRALMRQAISILPVLLLAFVFNTAGGLWTYLVLNERPSPL
jgi:hypothetical protein